MQNTHNKHHVRQTIQVKSLTVKVLLQATVQEMRSADLGEDSAYFQIRTVVELGA